MHFVLNKLMKLHSPQLTILCQYGWQPSHVSQLRRLKCEKQPRGTWKIKCTGTVLIQRAVALLRGICELHTCYLDGTSKTSTLCTGNK